jgi:hypothetical protein
MGKKRNKVVLVNDRMQKGYHYELVARIGQDFRSDFRPELTPKEMLSLGIFCGKPTAKKNFQPTGSREQAVARAPRLLAQLFRSECQSATIGMASGGGCQKRTLGRLVAGKLFAATSGKSNAIVQAIRRADHDNDKPCCTGPMIAEGSKAL